MTAGCLGQDSRKLSAETLLCPACRAEVEIFSDESRVRCHTCGEVICREKLPSCVDWCAAARQCLGEERWQKLKGNNGEGSKDAAT